MHLKSRNSINQIFSIIKFIQKKLELTIYDREHFVEFAKLKYVFVFLLTFIDNFDFYRNMYKTLTRIYVIIVNLNIKKKTTIEYFVFDSRISRKSIRECCKNFAIKIEWTW